LGTVHVLIKLGFAINPRKNAFLGLCIIFLLRSEIIIRGMTSCREVESAQQQ